jgi:hypothetical protein
MLKKMSDSRKLRLLNSGARLYQTTKKQTFIIAPGHMDKSHAIGQTPGNQTRIES